jgi:hypothetical protein
MDDHTKASPEIRKLIDKLAPANACTTNQGKYESIIRRKRYEHHCFLSCVVLRLDSHRGAHVACDVQELADTTYLQMFQHTM